MSNIRYPEIKVRLIGSDGNAYAVMGKVKSALQRGGVTAEEIDLYIAESTSGDYNHLLATAMKWVDVS